MEGKFQSKEKRASGRRTNINQRESAWFTLHIQRPAMFGATFTRREACRMRSSHVWWPSAPSRRILRPPRLRLVDVSFCLVADRNGGKWSAQSWAAQHLFLTPLKKTKRFERSLSSSEWITVHKWNVIADGFEENWRNLRAKFFWIFFQNTNNRMF